MSKSVWSGAITLGIVTLNVEATKATEEYRGKDSLRQVCECCNKPFSRHEVCDAGKRRATADTAKNNVENTTPLIMAAETGDGSFAPVDKAALLRIEHDISSDEIEPLALIDRADAPLELAQDIHYLRPSKKVPGAAKAVATFYAALVAENKVLVGKWASRGKQNLVAILPAHNGALAMVKIRYTAEVRAPETEVLDQYCDTNEAEVAMMSQLLAAAVPGADLNTLTDESVERKSEAIKAALDGTPVAEPTEVKPTAAPDLADALAASLAAINGEAVAA